MQHPDPDLLALAALPVEPRSPEITEHLGGCAECREEVAALRHTVELARAGRVDAATPPPRVWQAILDELNEQSETGGSQAPAELLSSLDPAAPHIPPAPPPQGQEPSAQGPPSPEPPLLGSSLLGSSLLGSSLLGSSLSGSSARVRPVGAARRSRWRAFALPIAAAVAGIAAGIGIGVGLGSPAVPPTVPAPTSTLLATLKPIGSADPLAAGTVDAVPDGGSQGLVIQVRGVSNTLGGDYLEAWLIDPAGTRLVSLGALTRAADGGAYTGEFTLPANLPMSEFNTVDISAERWDGDPSHSRISLLRGSMT
jgi:Anti-sigma-K factor rskA